MVVWSVAPSIALTWHINHFRVAVKRIKLLQWWSLLKKSTYWWTIYTCMYRLAWLKGSYINSSQHPSLCLDKAQSFLKPTDGAMYDRSQPSWSPVCVHYHNVVLRSEKRLMKASRPKSSHLSPFFHSWLHCFLWCTHNLKTDKSGLSLSLLHPLLVIICLGHKKDEIYFL